MVATQPKRLIKGHTAARPSNRVEVSVFLPPDLFYQLREAWNETPANVTFSAFVVAKIEAGIEATS